MKKWLSKLLIACLGCAIASIVGFFVMHVSHVSEKKQASTKTSSEQTSIHSPTITMKNIRLHEYEKSHDYEFIMTAQEGTFHHTSDKVECYNFTCNVLQHGIHVARINADKSSIDQLGKQLACNGQIKGTWKDLTIEGRDIGYSFLNQVMKTDKTMTYSHPQFSLSANQSIVNIATETIHMSNGVRAEFFIQQ